MAVTGINFEFVLVFFVYGLAFFSMGLALMLESGRSPFLAHARVLRPLAAFGLLHGIHEWLEMMLLLQDGFQLPIPPIVSWVRLGLLIVSFTSLTVYGLQVLQPHEPPGLKIRILFSVALLAVYMGLVVVTSVLHKATYMHWIAHADVLARYALAVPGAVVAALALNRQSGQARLDGRQRLGISLRLAAWGFAGYSLTQVFVPRVDLFPANLINSAIFTDLTGIPIQAVRAVLAVLITLGLIRATQIVELERQDAFLAAQQARLDAMAQVQRELEARAALRRELLRHTVIAQEDERARIARELHDETSQFLTALSLDLATLRQRQSAGQDSLLERLQSMSRQMSQGIYRMVHDLRPAQLDDLGLVAALQYLADDGRQRGLDVSLKTQGASQRLDPLVETVLFRVAQEALTNVVRHAQCKQASITVEFSPRQVVLRVQDTGTGFDMEYVRARTKGYGLAGMRERAESVGGRLSIASRRGDGTSVEIVVPYSRPEPLEHQEKVDEKHPADVG